MGYVLSLVEIFVVYLPVFVKFGSNSTSDSEISNLQELRDIVEQIDMAATFVKIGGFGRLIALVGPGYRPEKVQ